MEVERMVNRHQRGNRGHTENRQAEAAVYQHFEESLKLAQQQMTPNNPVIHVGSAQHQNFFLPNAVQMPHRMLPYQPFPSPSVGPPPTMPPQTPTPVMQPALGAAEMLWRPPTATVANANSYSTAGNGYYYHHRSNEQQILYSRILDKLQVHYRNVPITNSTTYDSSPSTSPSVLMTATYTETSRGIRTRHHKLKRAWV
ncbi:hypothetical protein AGLY_017291, partial [Aphis glycines]